MRRELDGVSDQRHQHLPHPALVAVHHARELGVDIGEQLQLGGGRAERADGADLLDHGAHVERRGRAADGGALEPREVDDSVDHAGQRVGGQAQRVNVLALEGVEVRAFEQAADADHAVQRRSQLATHRRDEARLDPVLRGLAEHQHVRATRNGRRRGELDATARGVEGAARGAVEQEPLETPDHLIERPSGAGEQAIGLGVGLDPAPAVIEDQQPVGDQLERGAQKLGAVGHRRTPIRGNRGTRRASARSPAGLRCARPGRTLSPGEPPRRPRSASSAGCERPPTGGRPGR